MAQKPAAPPPAEGAEPRVCGRYGPLAIERLAKADGRGLILYSRAAPQRRHEPSESSAEATERG